MLLILFNQPASSSPWTTMRWDLQTGKAYIMAGNKMMIQI